MELNLLCTLINTKRYKQYECKKKYATMMCITRTHTQIGGFGNFSFVRQSVCKIQARETRNLALSPLETVQFYQNFINLCRI
jgi:hypothetical protein